MKLMATVALVLGLTAVAAGPARGQEEVTVTGEIVDLACYLSAGKKGPEHRSCAQMCAKGGVPMGVLTEAGELYLLIDDHANKKPYDAAKKLAGSQAEISGKKFLKHGMASIMVSSAQGR
jgi:hypothetical protein